MDTSLLPIAIVVGTAILFDYTNGFHDTANAMATRNVTTWYFSIPSSSSHALIGGVIGAVIAAAGTEAVIWQGVVTKVIIPAVLAPFIGGGASALATPFSYRLTRNVSEESSARGYRLGQIGSSSLVALAHGTNDAQKTMGVIVLTLVAGGRLAPGAGVPFWVKFVCAAAIAIGTFSGGWRVIRTLGTRVTELQPTQGFAAETAGGSTILASSYFGFSLSTTQVVSGGIMGAGLGRPGGVVHWLVVRNMVVAWILTLPAAGLMGALAYGGTQIPRNETVGVIAVAIIAAAILGWLFWLATSGGDNVTSKNVVAPPVPRRARLGAEAAA